MENVRELFQILVRRIGLLNKTCCRAEDVELNVAQSHILFEIGRRHEPFIQQLAETLGMDVTTFSRQVQSLVEEGLVMKTPQPSDRRVHVLSLTEKGKRAADTVDRIMNSYFEEIFSHMTEFERETVIRSVRLINEAMAKSPRCCNPAGGSPVSN